MNLHYSINNILGYIVKDIYVSKIEFLQRLKCIVKVIRLVDVNLDLGIRNFAEIQILGGWIKLMIRSRRDNCMKKSLFFLW